jgi:hypothetical protein
MTETRDPTSRASDVAEVIRVGLVVAALALNAWIMWDYIKEQPEWKVFQRRATILWRKVITTPQEQAAKLRRMERETVFEAIQVVDEER